MTKQNGVDVWPNAAIWMRDDLRFKVRSHHQLPLAKSQSSVHLSDIMVDRKYDGLGVIFVI